MPCCKCNGSGARCRGCSCAKGKKGCIDCYPGRKGKCANSSFRPTASQTSSQPLLSTLSPSCASVQASQPSLIPLLSTAPPTRRALFISPFTAATSLLTAASNCSSPHIPPCHLPLRLFVLEYGIGTPPLLPCPGILRPISQL